MSKVYSFDHQNIKVFMQDLSYELHKLQEKFGVEFSLDKCKFAQGHANMNLSVIINGNKSKDEENLDFIMEHIYSDIDGSVPSKDIPSLGGAAKLIGYRGRKGIKRPFILEVLTGPEAGNKILAKPSILDYFPKKKK